jgi:hypothetical protein
MVCFMPPEIGVPVLGALLSLDLAVDSPVLDVPEIGGPS